MEEEGPRGDMTIQSGLSNSTESIDSMKALTAAIDAANAQVGPCESQSETASVNILSPNVCFHQRRSMDQPASMSVTAP